MLLGYYLKNTSELRHKPHIHQSVSLIDNHSLNLRGTDNAIHINIHKTSRSRYQQIDSLVYRSLLCPDIRSSVNADTTDIHILRQQLYTLTYLHH